MNARNGSLPRGWARIVLGGLCLPVEKTDPKDRPAEEFDYIDISSVDRETKTIVYPKRVSGSDAPSRARQVVQAGDIVFSTVRPNLQAVAQVPPGLTSPIASTGFCVLRPVTGLLPEYLFHAVLSDDFQARVLMKARGVSYPAVRDPDILSEHVSVPPVAEQRRIVRQLDGLLSDLRNGVEDFRRALTGLDQYRNACLAEAFGGATRRLEELSFVQSGIAKGRPGGDDLIEMPYIRTANVQALHLDLEEVKTLHVTRQQSEKHRLQEDDVLILEGGDADKVGRGWIWSGEVEDCLHQNHVFAVRPEPAVLLPRFLAYYVNAPQARRYFLSVAKQTTNLASINKSNLKALPVPVPTLEAQRRVVANLDSQLSATTEMEAGLREKLRDATVLRRSLLHAGIEGQLVPQDPNDGPVEEILQQARDEQDRHAAGAKATRKKRRAVPVGR